MKAVFYQGSYPWKYFNISWLTGKAEEVTEENFFKLVGTDRRVVPMHYDKENINRQNFYLNDMLIAYRTR